MGLPEVNRRSVCMNILYMNVCSLDPQTAAAQPWYKHTVDSGAHGMVCSQ